ncbi:MAG: Ig-like domain-containing protein [Clostridia bacterium]|nr:Ig-like domain-containing protein [Clostridia bacterium]
MKRITKCIVALLFCVAIVCCALAAGCTLTNVKIYLEGEEGISFNTEEVETDTDGNAYISACRGCTYAVDAITSGCYTLDPGCHLEGWTLYVDDVKQEISGTETALTFEFKVNYGSTYTLKASVAPAETTDITLEGADGLTIQTQTISAIIDVPFSVSTIPDDAYTLEGDCTFNGWTLYVDGEETEMPDDGTFTPESGHTYVLKANTIIPVESVTVSQSAVSLTLGSDDVSKESASVTVSVTPDNASSKNWTASSSDTGVATVTESGEGNGSITITAVSKGNATITVTASDGSGKSADIEVTVTQLVTGISADASQAELPAGVSIECGITVTPSDATDTSWTASSADSSVARVSLDNDSFSESVTGTGDATLYINGEGIGETAITITSTDGNATYSISVTVVASETGFSITSYDDTLYVGGGTSAFAATMYFSDNSSRTSGFTWSSSDPSVATVNNYGEVTPVAKGTTTITASCLYEGETYTTAGVVVTVVQLVTEIKTSETSVSLTVNGSNNTAAITVSAEPSDADVQTWTAASSNESIATVSQSGDTITITAVATGSASIIIASTDGGAEAAVNVSVTNPISGISISSDLHEITVGSSTALDITVTPSDADETGWTISSNSDAVTLGTTSGAGTETVTVTGAKAGTAAITVISTADSNITASIEVTVVQLVTEITAGESSVSLILGGDEADTTADVTISITPDDASNKDWTATSDNEDVATATSSGEGDGSVTIKAVKAGTATITIASADGNARTTISVTVTQLVTSIEAGQSSVSLVLGTDDTANESATVAITVTPSDASDAAWTASSSDTGVATVTESGNGSGNLTITATAAGTATITITGTDANAKTATVQVTVTQLVTGFTLGEESVDLTLGGDSSLASTIVTVQVDPSDATNQEWTVSSDDTSVATVAKSGDNSGVVITAVKAGDATITITASDDGAVTATISVSVTQLVTKIEAASNYVELPVGETSITHTDEITTIEPSDASNMNWTATSNDTTVATVTPESGTGTGVSITITGVAMGEATITIGSEDGNVTYEITVKVVAAETAFSITSSTSTLYVDGDSSTFVATMYFSDGTSITEGFTWTSSDSSVATVEDGVVTPVAKGTTTITATYEYEDETFTVSNPIELTVEQLVTSIEAGENSVDLVLGGDSSLASATVDITVAPSDANNQAWTATSDNESVATVTASGEGTGSITITAVAAGTATITIKASDNGGETAIITVNVTQLVTSITADEDSVSLILGGDEDDASTTVAITVEPSNATNAAWTATSNDETVATVEYTGNGTGTVTITAVAAGTTTITITGLDANAKTTTITVTVTQLVTNITADETSVTLILGSSDTANESATVTITVEPTDATNAAWTASSSDTDVATVTGTGNGTGSITITAVAAGTATITITGADANAKTVAISVTVTQLVTEITASESSVDLILGSGDTANESATVTITVDPSDATNGAWTAESSNTGVATVEYTGNGTGSITITAVAAGEATITITGTDANAKTASITVNVTQYITGFTLGSDSVALILGGDADDATADVTVAAVPTDASNQNWTVSSSNTGVATVSKAGDDSYITITAVAAGEATITITASDNGAKTVIISVSVTQLVTKIEAEESSVSLTLGTDSTANESATVAITVSPDDASNAAWTATSDDEDVATVTSGGTGEGSITIKAVKAGTATITIASSDGNASTTITVSVTQLVTSITLEPSTDTDIIVGDTLDVTVMVGPEDVTDDSWTVSSGNDSVASITKNENGTFTITGATVSATPVTITVTAGDGSGVTAAITVTVVAREEGFSITTSTDTLYVDGDTFTFEAAMTFSDSTSITEGFTWTSSDSTVATVDSETGVVTPLASGTTDITATYEYEGTTYTTTAVTVRVIQLVTAIETSESEVNLTVNGSATVTISVTPDNADDQTWSAVSNSASVATVTDNGNGTITITAVSVGSTSIVIASTDQGAEAVITVVVTNPVTGIEISADSTSINVGDSTSATITVTPSAPDDASWTITVTGDSSAVTLSQYAGSGEQTITITGLAEGEAVVTVTSGAEGTVSDYVNITVSKIYVSAITTSSASVTLTYQGESETVTVTVEPANATDGTWTAQSNDTSVATITYDSSSIIITPAGAGSTTITITAADGSGVTADIEVNVTVAVSGVSIDQGDDTITLEKGSTFTLTATVTPDNASNKNVAWSSSDTSVVTVEDGVITAVAAGTATITVKTEDGEYEDSIEVLVPNHVTAMAVTEDDTEVTDVYAIVDGEAVVLTVTLTAQEDSKPITYDGWTAEIVSGDEYISIRTVNDNIRITGVAGGEATITVTPNDTANVSEKTITVKVIQASITGTESIIIYSETNTTTLTLNLTNLTSEDITSVTWNSSNPEIATVAGNETSATTATVTKASDDQFGSTTITATAETAYGDVTATYVVCVTANYFYLAGVNQDSWTSDYDSADAAKEAGVLLEASDDNPYVYSVTIHISLDETLYGFAICFDGMPEDYKDIFWGYAIRSGSVYYDEAHSSAEYVTSYGDDNNLQVTASGDYVITLDFSAGGPAVLTICQAGIDVSEVTLTLTGDSASLNSTTNTSVTYTYSVGPADAQYSNDEVSVELISYVDGWESYMELDTDYTSNTVTVICIGDPYMTFTLTLVVTIQDVESNLMYITVNASSGTAVYIEKITYDEDSYAYNVNNGGSAWTTAVHALATDAEGNVASDETVTYAPAAGYEDYITVKTTSKGGVVTATTLGTFKVTATSNGDSSITADIEVTFYSDTFYLYIGSTEWTELDQTATTIEGTKVADLGLTAADSTNKVFTGTFDFTSTYTDSEFFILYLGWAGWGDDGFTVNGDFLDTTNSNGAYVNPDGSDDHFEVTTAGTYTITIDLSGTDPVVTINLMSSDN